MSKILEKAFDASKKIIRSVFRGSPNLITTSDLNRQFEAFKYQIDQLDDKTGMLSDIEISHSLNSGTLSVSYDFSYIKFKGCSFSPEKKAISTNFTNSAPTAYLCLIADKKAITYADDFTHDIAGAKFSDETSMPASDQYVYINEQVILTHAVSSVNNLVGIIATFRLSEDTGNVLVKKNTILENNSLSMSSGGAISELNYNLSGAVSSGKTYDEAFSILENRANNLVTNWTFLKDRLSDEKMDTDIAFRLQNGVMYLNMPAQHLHTFTSRMGGKLLRLGRFPSEIKSTLLSMFKSLNMTTYNKFNEDSIDGARWIPYGEFGTFPVFSEYQASIGQTSEAYPKYGFAKISLVVSQGDNDTFDNIEIAAYVDHYLQFTSDGKVTFHKGPIDWLDLQSPQAYIETPRIFGVIPLPGKF